jgi:hypothetical protein
MIMLINIMGKNDKDILNLFEDAEIWPVEFVLPQKVGYTLWGTNSVRHDVFLCQEGRIVFFQTLSSLFDFIKSQPKKDSLSIFPGYNKLDVFFTDNDFSNNIDIEHFDFVSVQQIICRHQFNNLMQCAKVLNCLNFLYDVGMTLDEKTILSEMKRGHGELADLMDTLTFIKKDELHVLNQFDFHLICQLYTRFLEFFDQRSAVL